ncbi:MAG TPA: urease subunit gamma [Candidatus Limnocylindrales bacterium]|nr:urease subunit gamma [Candidatus Limnocylindrales bacterium]
MRLTRWEEERLLIFSAAELARRHRAAGILLNHPETVALICDAMLEAARAGASLADVEAAGRGAVQRDEVMDGVSALVDEVRLEILTDDGTRLVVLVDPLGPANTADDPGVIIADPDGDGQPRSSSEVVTLSATNQSRRIVRVSSHYPFERVNTRLIFDRSVARGRRLDLPAGTNERWAPGETKTVRLIPYRGAAAGEGG